MQRCGQTAPARHKARLRPEAVSAWRDEQLQSTQELCLSVPTGSQDERRRLLLYRREWLAWALAALHTLLMQLGLLVLSGPWLSGAWGSTP